MILDELCDIIYINGDKKNSEYYEGTKNKIQNLLLHNILNISKKILERFKFIIVILNLVSS